MQLGDDALGAVFGLEEPLVHGDELVHVVLVFVQQLNAVAAETEAHEAADVTGCRLGLGVEEGVAAAFVATQVVHHAGAVEYAYFVVLAGAAAVEVVLAFGEEGAEDAVLHMEEGHVLVQGDF